MEEEDALFERLRLFFDAGAQAQGYFEVRPSQVEMAVAILRALLNQQNLVVEAPTGIGKTVAYLLPSALSSKRVVISTHTKALQDQIIDKDFPLLASWLPEIKFRLARDFDHKKMRPKNTIFFSQMKGRSNYLCKLRLKNLRAELGMFVPKELKVIEEWETETRTGDAAELFGFGESSELFARLDARSEICIGTKCAHYEECFVVKMRREAERSDLIVVNHSLLLSDAALRAKQNFSVGRVQFELIPEAQALVVDEAHALRDIALQHFGSQTSSTTAQRLEKDLNKNIVLLSEVSRQNWEKAWKNIHKVYETLSFNENPDQGRFALSTWAKYEDFKKILKEAIHSLRHIQSFVAKQTEKNAAIESSMEPLLRRVQELLLGFEFVLKPEIGSGTEAKFVAWGESNKQGTTLGISPTEANGLLSEYIYPNFKSIILTSATLSLKPKDDLQFFANEVGLSDPLERLVLDTPFDYFTQSVLYLPENPVEPDSSNYIPRLEEEMIRLVNCTPGGALLLFTSIRVMKLMHERLAKKIRGRLLFIQGEAPKTELIQRFIEKKPAVLFGTASFWEGVDIAGDALQLVVMDKLPFDPPNDPILLHRFEELRSAGRHPFTELQLPRAVIRLRQGFGRLIRTRSDRGVVAVMDGRIFTKSYGKRVLNALPNARRIRRFQELEDWWRGFKT